LNSFSLSLTSILFVDFLFFLPLFLINICICEENRNTNELVVALHCTHTTTNEQQGEQGIYLICYQRKDRFGTNRTHHPFQASSTYMCNSIDIHIHIHIHTHTYHPCCTVPARLSFIPFDYCMCNSMYRSSSFSSNGSVYCLSCPSRLCCEENISTYPYSCTRVCLEPFIYGYINYIEMFFLNNNNNANDILVYLLCH